MNYKKKKISIFLFSLLICAVISVKIDAQELKSFKLPNGLSVFIWEDPSAPDIFGMVTVKAGGKDDPEKYTGLAHYLEHLMFKGNDKIGSLDWEKEKPFYEQIIAKYDEYAEAADPAKKEAISAEINQLTIESAKYSLIGDFMKLTQSMGGEDLNAGTSYDYTSYFNSFPPGEIYKWLELNSERLLNPVFRSFQPELETVYEEYNRIQDQQTSRESEFLLSTIFAGHPYARPLVGLPEHLKNPQLSQLIKFYNDWYVADNMALILAGNVNTNQVLPIIREKFGRIENRPAPERVQYPETPLKGRKAASAKIARYPQALLAFPGITTNSEDDITLDICTSILSNSNRTGLIDKLVIDGDLMFGGAEVVSLRERGSILVYAIPYYDVNQRRFESLRSTERILLNEIKKLQEGKFDEWLVHSIQSNMIRSNVLMMESPERMANMISNHFVADKNMDELLNYVDLVSAITVDDIKRIAQKYFGSDYYALSLEEGKPPKTAELEKPKYDPILPVRNIETKYSEEFRNLPVIRATGVFPKMDDVVIRPINDRSKLFYTHNPENEIFTLSLKFGIGTEKMPKLELSTSLMNNAGIMGQMEAQEVKQEFSNLGASCSYSVNESYLTVRLNGFESNLEETCNLLTRQILMPQLDEKQMNNLKGSFFQQRRVEKTVNESLAEAMQQYILYQDKSPYIDRLPMDDINALSISNLTGEFQRATDYEAEIHYVGSLPVDEVYEILSKNLPLKDGEKPTTSPEVKQLASYNENTVFFLPNTDAKQSSIIFYIESDVYKKEKDPFINAFHEYFGIGFNSLVFQEIREFRSMAYRSYGLYDHPPVENKNACFVGVVGTQADKTMDALDIYMDLLTNMPQYPNRMVDIKNFLKGTASVEKPHFRSASQVYQNWKLRGYTKSPAETNMPVYDNMTFDDIVKFYNENIKGRPIVIGIVGNPKIINEKALAKYGKVVRLTTAKVFSEK